MFAGQGYGVAKAQADAQRLVPAGPPPTAASPATPPLPPAPMGPPAGSLGPLDRATERPDEPLTQGAPIGAGAGPEILRQGDTAAVGPYLPTLEVMASQGDSTMAFRAFVRRLRGSL